MGNIGLLREIPPTDDGIPATKFVGQLHLQQGITENRRVVPGRCRHKRRDTKYEKEMKIHNKHQPQSGLRTRLQQADNPQRLIRKMQAV